METSSPHHEQAEIDAAKLAELEEIWMMLQNIRRSSGYGRVVLELRSGEITDMEQTIKRKPKVQKKNYQ